MSFLIPQKQFDAFHSDIAMPRSDRVKLFTCSDYGSRLVRPRLRASGYKKVDPLLFQILGSRHAWLSSSSGCASEHL